MYSGTTSQRCGNNQSTLSDRQWPGLRMPMVANYGRVINLDEPWVRGYWTDSLGVSEAQLREAVLAVGELVVDVKRYLGK